MELYKRGFLNMFSYYKSCSVWFCLAGLGRMGEICMAQAPELSRYFPSPRIPQLS